MDTDKSLILILAGGLTACFALILQLRKGLKMASTKADLDAALDKFVTRVTAVLEDLKAKVAAGTAQPEDFDAEIAKLNDLTSVADSDDPDFPEPVDPNAPTA